MKAGHLVDRGIDRGIDSAIDREIDAAIDAGIDFHGYHATTCPWIWWSIRNLPRSSTFRRHSPRKVVAIEASSVCIILWSIIYFFLASSRTTVCCEFERTTFK